jgi:hypothetical protein
MDNHEHFDLSIMPQIEKLVKQKDNDSVESNLERFLEILKHCKKDSLKSQIINNLLDSDTESDDFHDRVRDVFNLISHQECCLEKIVYLKNFDRTTVEFDVKEPD